MLNLDIPLTPLITLKEIGPYSQKQYSCNHCGNIKIIGTNHWGDLYTRCHFCCAIVGMTCKETMPEGYTKPEPYKLIKKE